MEDGVHLEGGQKAEFVGNWVDAADIGVGSDEMKDEFQAMSLEPVVFDGQPDQVPGLVNRNRSVSTAFCLLY